MFSLSGYTIDALVFEGLQSRAYRGRDTATDALVVIKTPRDEHPRARTFASYQRAYDIGAALPAGAAVRHLALVRFRASVALVMEDFGDTLDLVIPPTGMATDLLLRVGVATARALAGLHAAGVVHKDVKPANLGWNAASSQARLLDLGIATRVQRENTHGSSQERLEGTIAYMSPEQTGKISRSVEHRSDLYSLGATLFEAATGRLPFVATDPGELLHAHIARRPPRVSDLRPDLPPVVSDIVDRLLEKNVDDRYASAFGVARDFTRALREFETTGECTSFPVGADDVSPIFRLPQRLFGRETEIAALLAEFDYAVGRTRRVVEITGISGIGKTALVHEVERVIAERGGAFCEGKFDQFRRDIPYYALVQAIASLVATLLAQPEKTIERYRRALADAVGAFGALLVEVVPELETLLGPPRAVEPLGPTESQRRFARVFTRFVDAWAQASGTLVIFVDDMQWADSASMHVFESLASDVARSPLLLVCGYRSNDVGVGHPLRETLDRLRGAHTPVQSLRLEPLALDAVTSIVADTVQRSRTDAAALSARIHDVSRGNPFFVQEILVAIHQRGGFTFDPELPGFTWNLQTLPATAVTDNVADLLTLRLADVSPVCREVLRTAACIGSTFDLATLARAAGIETPVVADRLALAVRSGVIIPLDADYKLYEGLARWGEAVPDDVVAPVRYRFQHDRVREAVHAELDTAARAERHLQIARLLLEPVAGSTEATADAIDVFNHVCHAKDHVRDPAERLTFARLGLAAGRTAAATLAFDAAQVYLDAALGLLPDDRWETHRELTLAVSVALAESAFARADLAALDRAVDAVLAHTDDSAERVAVQLLKIRTLSTQNRYADAADLGIAVARSLGVSLPRHPGMGHILVAVARTFAAVGGRDPLSFVNVPAATDPRSRAVAGVIRSVASAAYFCEPNLLPVLGMTATRLGLRDGVTPDTPYGFAVWGLVLCGVLGRIDTGYRFGQLALETAKRFPGAYESGVRFVVHMSASHWKEPLPDVTEALLGDWQQNIECGDEESATYSAGVMLYTHFFAGRGLDAGERFADPIASLVRCNQIHVKDCFLAWVQLFDHLREPQLPDRLAGRWFDFDALLPGFVAKENGVQICIASCAAGTLDFFAGRHDRAEAHFARAAKFEEKIVGQVLVPALAWLRGMNAMRLLRASPNRSGLRGLATRSLRRLRTWERACPANLAACVALLDAEVQSSDGETRAAIESLHHAVEAAIASGAVLHEAMAEERLATVHAALGHAQLADRARTRAERLFRTWGAPGLASAALPARHSQRSTSTDTGTLGLDRIDLHSVLKSVRAVASEIEVDTLLRRVMSVVMEGAGADRGVLVLTTSGEPVVEMEMSAQGEVQFPKVPLAEYPGLVRAPIDFALRTGRCVIPGEPERSLPAVAVGGAASLMVAPIAHQGRSIGAIYLENRLTRGAFTPARLEVVEALAGQAAISIVNANLYAQLQHALDVESGLSRANRRFVPEEFLHGLGRHSITDVGLGDATHREMALIFADIRGFTAVSERIGPARTIGFINRYLSFVQPAIASSHGFVSQYYGDGLMALFPRSADDAVAAAIGMAHAVDRYNREVVDDADVVGRLRVGIGVHAGSLIMGTVGESERLQCSVVGDTVNLCSRVEGLTKQFGARVLVSGAVREAMVQPDRFGLRSMGRVRVVGRASPLELFEVIDALDGDDSRRVVASLPVFRQGLDAMRAGDFDAAVTAFERCFAAAPDDLVARRFATRCAKLRDTRPAWDGIDTIDAK